MVTLIHSNIKAGNFIFPFNVVGPEMSYRGSYGTIKPQKKFNAAETAKKLHKAMKGMGCDKSKVINELTRIDSNQRHIVECEYEKDYGVKLFTELESELHGDLEDVITALMIPPAVCDARELRQAVQGAGTNEKVLIDLICSRSNDELIAIKRAYESEFGRLLASDVKSDTSGDFKRLLLALLETKRDDGKAVEDQRAFEAAQSLYVAGEKKWGTDEATFNIIFSTQSTTQLRAVCDQYSVVAGHGIEKAIQSEFSGDAKRAYMTLIECIRNKPKYFANRINHAIKGMGTHDRELIRIIVQRAEFDLALIRDEYRREFGTKLVDAIRSECSGKYKDSLIAIVQGN